MPNSGQMPPGEAERGDTDRSSDSGDSGDIAGASIPGTRNNSQSPGASEGASADANGEIANAQSGTDILSGIEAGLPGSQPGSDMPDSSASNTAGNGESGVDISVQADGLPGLEPFPGGLPGDNSSSLEDIFGSGSEGTEASNGNSGSQSASGG